MSIESLARVGPPITPRTHAEQIAKTTRLQREEAADSPDYAASLIRLTSVMTSGAADFQAARAQRFSRSSRERRQRP